MLGGFGGAALDAGFAPDAEQGAKRSARRAAVDATILHTQVLLDRAGFSVGVIDARPGTNTAIALAAFRASRKLETAKGSDGKSPGRDLDAATLDALGARDQPATASYAISRADAAGPFIERLPDDLMEQGKLEALHYRSLIEMLAERFHTTDRLLRALNPSAAFVEGESIDVPAVEPLELPARSARRDGAGVGAAKGHRVVVTKSPSQVTVFDGTGSIVFHAPVTSGSSQDPLPIGTWKVTDVYLLPKFHYNPELFWDADPNHAKTPIAPGPNNPAGTVWIDIDKEHYGLHGTPAPETVGKTASHGCVRLTNWDALRLAAVVAAGTPVVFQEAP
jgi:lipoprotein-anchoring transpeptidase ErfK/SrfK